MFTISTFACLNVPVSGVERGIFGGRRSCGEGSSQPSPPRPRLASRRHDRRPGGAAARSLRSPQAAHPKKGTENSGNRQRSLCQARRRRLLPPGSVSPFPGQAGAGGTPDSRRPPSHPGGRHSHSRSRTRRGPAPPLIARVPGPPVPPALPPRLSRPSPRAQVVRSGRGPCRRAAGAGDGGGRGRPGPPLRARGKIRAAALPFPRGKGEARGRGAAQPLTGLTDARQGVPLPPPPLAGPVAGTGPRRGPAALGRPRRRLRGGARGSPRGVGVPAPGFGPGQATLAQTSAGARGAKPGPARSPDGLPRKTVPVCGAGQEGSSPRPQILADGEGICRLCCSPDSGARSAGARRNNFCTTFFFLPLTSKRPFIRKIMTATRFCSQPVRFISVPRQC